MRCVHHPLFEPKAVPFRQRHEADGVAFAEQ